MKRFTKNQENSICALYLSGLSMPNIAKKYKTTHTLISRYLTQNNIKLRPRNRLNAKQILDIIKLYKDNAPISRIAKKYNLSYNTIWKYLKKTNIKLRTRSESLYKGAKINNGKGYINVTPRKNEKHLNPGKYSFMAEHRLVMARHLNRALKSHENVHHINGIKTDNRLENLELWSRWQPNGQRVSDKIRWAQELLKFYKKEVKLLKKRVKL